MPMIFLNFRSNYCMCRTTFLHHRRAVDEGMCSLFVGVTSWHKTWWKLRPADERAFGHSAEKDGDEVRVFFQKPFASF